MNPAVRTSNDNRFVKIFGEPRYVKLKQHLYNYRLRKRAVRRCLRPENPAAVLEIGSGISPVATPAKGRVYSDLSFEAVKILKRNQKSGDHVVADGARLPFKPNCFSAVICSEVLEHMDDDRQALREMARTVKIPDGSVILTVPHRKGYFALDDRFVDHRRRYEIDDICQRLAAAGLKPVLIRKVLGPLEKFTMMAVIFSLTALSARKPGRKGAQSAPMENRMAWVSRIFGWINHLYMGFVWLDAMIMPRSLSAVILLKSVPGVKNPANSDCQTD